ncbi:hypothetical protein JCM10213_007968 [Rhodosporidiobolus nylandii]
MVKLITNRVCCCAVCRRAQSAPTSFPRAPLSNSVGEAVEAQARSFEVYEGLQSKPELDATDVRAVASSSSRPYLPPPSIRLPDELLEIILRLARPPLPPATTDRVPLPLPWRAFAQLSLVHSRWHDVARQELARVVILRSDQQVKALTKALKEGWVQGRVEEILLEMKETASGSEDAAEKQSKTDAGAPLLAEQADEDVLLDLLRECGADLKALRLRGFGDPALVHFSPATRQHLSRLETFEYSPIDSAQPPSTAALILGLSSLPSLKHLVLAPSSRYLTPLHNPPDEVLEALTGLLENLPALLNDASLRGLYKDTFVSCGTHHLTSLSLHSLALTPLTLFGLLFPSLVTLTHLSLSSTFFVGSAATLFDLLSSVAPQLEVFEWEDRLINPVPAAAPPLLRQLGQSSLSADAYWQLLKQLAKVKKLKLFSPRVFESCPARAGFVLPPNLEELSIGSRAEVEEDEVTWWLERIEALLDSKEPVVEEAEEEEEPEPMSGGSYEVDDAEDQDEGDAAEGMPKQDSSEAEKADSAAHDPTRSSSSSLSATSSGASSAPSASTLLPTSVNPPSDSLTSSSSSSTVAASPSPAPLPAAGKSAKGPSSRKRRLAWRNPPQPPIPPQLRSFALCTMNTELRDDCELQDRIEELVVERGVAVSWASLHIVSLDALDLTRDLRMDMARVRKQD